MAWNARQTLRFTEAQFYGKKTKFTDKGVTSSDHQAFRALADDINPLTETLKEDKKGGGRVLYLEKDGSGEESQHEISMCEPIMYEVRMHHAELSL